MNAGQGLKQVLSATHQHPSTPPVYLHPSSSLWQAPIPLCLKVFTGSLVAQLVKNPPAMQEIWVQSLGWGDLLVKGQATHSSILGLPLWLTGHTWRKSITFNFINPLADGDTTI